jgi:ATP-dependent Clp protease, protease subunit
MKNKFQQLYRDNAQRPAPSVVGVRNEASATIYLYDVIDAYWGVSAKAMIEALDAAQGVPLVNLHINSPGGDVFESRAIIAAMNRFDGKIVAHIDSLAASAATSIALAASEVVISQGAFFMIHNASGLVWGDKTAMRETADLLEKIEGAIVADYTGKTGKNDQQIIDWMNAETWFSADEAIAEGFCDRLADAPKAKNTWNLAAFDKAPKALLEPENDAAPEPQPTMTQANANRLRLTTVL